MINSWVSYTHIKLDTTEWWCYNGGGGDTATISYIRSVISMKRVHGSLGETIEAFMDESNEFGRNATDTLYFQNEILYSYGAHFPMCIKIKDVNGNDMYWINGARYSSTTSKHQAVLFRSINERQRIEIPYDVIMRIDSGGTDVVKELVVVDADPDTWIDTGRVNEWGYPIQNHQLGCAVIQYKKRYFLSGIDETGRDGGLYHLTELYTDKFIPSTVDEAYEMLQPESVKQAYRDGIDVRRQGEWFFIAVDDALNKILDHEQIASQGLLHHDSEKPARHRATYYTYYNGKQYVKGTVRHIAGDHKMCKLYPPDVTKKKWHEAIENVQVTSWSLVGKID